MTKKHERIGGIIPGITPDIGHKVSDDAGHTGYGDTRSEAEEALRVAQKHNREWAEKDTRPIIGDILPGYVFGENLEKREATRAAEEEATRRARERARADEQQQHARESSSSDNSGAELIGKLIGIVIVAAAVIWFVFSIAIPLFLINVAVIALIAGLVIRGWKKVLFPLSIAGSVLLVADVSRGWSTKTLVSNVSLFGGLIPIFFYLNILAGLIAAYFIVRDFLNARTPQETSAGEFTTRNMITMGCLLLVGGLTVGVQQYLAPPGRFASQAITTVVPPGNRAPASRQGDATPNGGGANYASVQGSFPFASQRLLTDSDLAGFSKTDLKIMRNEVFARHGYIFRTPEMHAYFAKQSWYHGEFADVTSMLTAIEQYNVALIKKHE